MKKLLTVLTALFTVACWGAAPAVLRTPLTTNNNVVISVIPTNASTATFQSLLNLGGNIYVPSGNYSVSNLFLTNNTRLWGGPGARLSMAAGATSNLLDTLNNTNIQIENLILEGGLTAMPVPRSGSRNAIRFNADKGADSWIKNVTINGFNGYGLWIFNTIGTFSAHTNTTPFFRDISARFCGTGYFLTFESPSDSAEYVLLSGLQATACALAIYKAPGNTDVSDSRFTFNTAGVLLQGPGGNGQHGRWTGCNFNHNDFGVLGTNVSFGEDFVACSFLGQGPGSINNAIILNNCTGINFVGNNFGTMSIMSLNNADGNEVNGFVANRFQGTWASQKNQITNDGGLFFLNNWGWSGGAYTDSSFSLPFVIRPTRYFLGSADTSNELETYSALNTAPSPWFDADILRFNAGGGGFAAYVPGQTWFPSTQSIVTVGILATNANVITNLSAPILYYADGGRIYLTRVVFSTITLTAGHNYFSFTNHYTNTSPRAIGVELAQGTNTGFSQWVTSIREQPLQ